MTQTSEDGVSDKGRLDEGNSDEDNFDEESEARYFDVLIVGAGPAGIGMALMLEKLPAVKYAILEQAEVGESFRRWPKQTRLITPSFNSTPFGLADLNAVNENSSPAAHAGVEHLSGQQYADYLDFIARAHDLPILDHCSVGSVEQQEDDSFTLVTEVGELYTQILIWATGEYQFPDLNPFPGGEKCLHYTQVEDWTDFNAPDYTVIGGYESGIDASYNLIKSGCQVRLLTRESSWNLPEVYDPSLTLSPYSRERLLEMQKTGRLEVIFSAKIIGVDGHSEDQFILEAEDGRQWQSASQPILATGFRPGGGAIQIDSLWARSEKGTILLTEADESTLTPNLFLVGPQVRQEKRIYCFIYKFRQRFAFIAEQVAQRLELYTDGLHGLPGNWGPFGNPDCCEGCEC